jgi:excisionase family DNA binding protein
MENDYEILTVKEVSELLRVSPSTVYKLTRESRIPAFKIGSDWRLAIPKRPGGALDR